MDADLRSDSVYYHGDCTCPKTETSSTIVIQCANCINNTNEPLCEQETIECTCTETRIRHFICNTCAPIRDKIDMLRIELDEILYNVGYEIKQYMDCMSKIERIKQISIELQHCNRRLLENLVSKNNEHYG